MLRLLGQVSPCRSREVTLTIIHPKPINQSPMVLLLHAAAIIEDAMDSEWLGYQPLDEDLKEWLSMAEAWMLNYSAYVNREHGDDNV